MCVRNANDALPSLCWFISNGALDNVVDFLCSRLDASDGWSRALSRAICASLRVFSATSAAFNFWVSMSLRRRV